MTQNTTKKIRFISISITQQNHCKKIGVRVYHLFLLNYDTILCMKLHSKKLKNGLTIQAIEMSGTNVITSLILVGAGSRYEDKNVNGIAHFLEHMFFKGGEKYETHKEVSASIDGLGAEFNAFTDKEVVGYYVKSAKQHLDKSLDVLSDMLIKARFPKEELEKERGVVLEEIAMYLDLPMHQIGDDFKSLLFGDQPIGRNILGAPENIKSVTQKDFFDYKNALYVPENIVITLAGAVTEKDISKVEQYFHFGDEKQTITASPFDEEFSTKKYSVREKQTEQYHISFGVLGLSSEDKRYPAEQVLSTILGGNMSSRMFLNIREDKGLCYSIRTSSVGFDDTGLLTTRAGVKLSKVLDAIEAIRDEYNKITENGITEKELLNAKAFLLGRTDLKIEDTEEVAYYYGENMLLHKKQESVEKLKQKIEVVTKDEVNELAKELLQPERYRFAGIGPKMDEKKLLSLIS